MCFPGAVIHFQICAVGSYMTQIKTSFSWGLYGVILSHWFWKQDLCWWLPLTLSYLGEQRQKSWNSTLLASLGVPSTAYSCMPERSQGQETSKMYSLASGTPSIDELWISTLFYVQSSAQLQSWIMLLIFSKAEF